MKIPRIEQFKYLYSLNEIDAVKEQIEDWFSELKKPSLEVGKWYKNQYGAMWFFQGYDKETYGFRSNGLFTKNASIYWKDIKILATPQEEAQALTKEAVKRGFKEGVKFKRVKGVYDIEYNLLCNDFYLSNANILYYKGKCIFYNGVWATIIENTLPSDIEKLSLKYGKEALINYLKN